MTVLVKLLGRIMEHSKLAIFSDFQRFSSERDDTIEALYFDLHYNVSFLPEHLDANFPNLVYYYAEEGSVTEIYKNNFKGLNKLKVLDLWDNLITEIASDTFEDLSSLEKLDSGKKDQIAYNLCQ